jgi:hypothetical protein
MTHCDPETFLERSLKCQELEFHANRLPKLHENFSGWINMYWVEGVVVEVYYAGWNSYAIIKTVDNNFFKYYPI